jgi:hypothetical protein
MSRQAPHPTFRAWLVAYVDPNREPPSIFEAGIFPDNRPTKAERHNGFAQIVLLQTDAVSYASAVDQIKQILCGPDWRWLYRVPVLTAGFQHRWVGESVSRVCRVCGVKEKDTDVRSAGERDPDRCLVSHEGTCSGCGERRPILQGDALCVLCRYPITQNAS